MTGPEVGGARLTGLGGRVALVVAVAGAGDLERAIARRLAEAGCHAVLACPDAGAGPGEGGEHEQAGPADGLLELGCHPTDVASVEALAGQVLRRLGRVDFVVMRSQPVQEASSGDDLLSALAGEHWDAVVAANLRSALLVSRCLGKVLVRQGDGGALLTVTDVPSDPVPAGLLAYCASTAAARSLSACLAAELGPHAVRVNTVRLASPPVDVGQVADLVVFLCSEQGSWVTGEHVTLDGGGTVPLVAGTGA